MRTTTAVSGVIVALAVAAVAASAGGQQQGDAKMSPEQQAAMEAWMKVATPGEGHKALAPMVGAWNVKTTSWQRPGAPPQTSTGTAANTWVLGGRFLRQEVHGEFAGMRFDGLGFTGYDNYKKEYVGTWMDTMGTMMMTMEGTADPTGKVFTMTSTIDDVVTGKPVKVRSVTRVVDENRHVMEMFAPDPTGKEFKSLEIIYTRK